LVAWREADGTITRRTLVGPRCHKPLAEICRPDFSYAAWALTHSEVAPHPDLMKLWKWMATDELATLLGTVVGQWAHTVKGTSAIDAQDVKVLKKSGTAVDGGLTRERMRINAFKVPKGDHEARLVLDGRRFDDMLRTLEHQRKLQLPPMPPLHIRDTIDTLLAPSRTVIATVDAKSMFYQFHIHPTLSAFFALSGFENVRFAALPMGITFAPAWAQHLSNHLLAVTRARYARERHTGEWDAAAWIDNYIFAADNISTMEHVKTIFLALASEVNMRLKEWTVTEGATHTLEALGILLDVRARTAAPTAKSREVMNRFRTALRDERATMTARSFLTFFGHASFVSYAVLRYPLCLIPGLMREQRRLARLRHYDEEPTTLSDAEAVEAIQWLDRLTAGRFVMQPPWRQPPVEYCTDASGTGIGIVIVPVPTGHITRVRVQAPLGDGPIFASEMLAGLIAAPVAQAGGTWVVDNTSAAYAMIRGHSGSDVLDALLRLWIQTAKLPSAIKIVKSEQQIADALSRPTVDGEIADNSLSRLDDEWRSVSVALRKWTIPRGLLKE
jgi:hypothetical protein